MPSPESEARVRSTAFAWLTKQRELHGDVLPRQLLLEGFSLGESRVPLMSPQQGIFKPAVLARVPLSITTTPNSSYSDRFEHGRLLYAYRGTDPSHRDNVGLREAMHGRYPLVYFHGVIPGRYLATWPVFIAGDNPKQLTFLVDLGEAEGLAGDLRSLLTSGAVTEPDLELRREYAVRTFRQRLHQDRFRERVLRAYKEQCAVCRLRHAELLDAAHIVEDREEFGEPVVPNGLALCKLHHAAFDRYFIAVRPDYVIEVRQDVLDEEDGPMLLHGLKGLHLREIHFPRSRMLYPDPQRLEWRYSKFKKAV